MSLGRPCRSPSCSISYPSSHAAVTHPPVTARCSPWLFLRLLIQSHASLSPGPEYLPAPSVTCWLWFFLCTSPCENVSPFPITTILLVIYYHTSFDFTRPFWLMGRISERLYQSILLQAVEFLQDPSGLKQVLQCIFFSNLDQLIIIITAWVFQMYPTICHR